ncbi:MAG: hypothetical protein KDH84_21910, partial [Calditrichaeota bacterium]|nr:hypothetical protein [Calditrichota bacterium]
MVASRPGFVGVGVLSPGEGDLQLRVLQQAGFIFLIEQRRFRHPPVRVGGAGLFIHPGFQALPVADQAFVRNIDQGIRREGFL